MDSKSFVRLLADTRMSGQQLRILLFLSVSIEFGSLAPVTPRIISRQLNIHESSVKRSIRTLIEDGYITKRYETRKLIGYVIREEKIK